MGDRNERTGDEASSRRERSETADGRCNPGHGKGSGSCREDARHGRGRHNRDGIHDVVALERVLMIRGAQQAPADVPFPDLTRWGLGKLFRAVSGRRTRRVEMARLFQKCLLADISAPRFAERVIWNICQRLTRP